MGTYDEWGDGPQRKPFPTMFTKAGEMSEALLDRSSTFLKSCKMELVCDGFWDDAGDCRCWHEYKMDGPGGAGFVLSRKRVMDQMGAGSRKRRFFFICNCSVICFSSFKHGILDSCIRFVGSRIPYRSCLIVVHWTVTMHLGVQRRCGMSARVPFGAWM